MKTSSLFIIFLVLTSCNFKRLHTQELSQENEPYFKVNAFSINYDQIQKNIITPSCIACHSGKHEPSLTNYQEVFSALKKIDQSVLKEKSMPKRKPLSSELRATLKAWISVGAPEFATETAETPSPTPTPNLPPLSRPVLFADFKARVLEPSCVSCHNQGNKDGLTSMEDYTSVKSVVEFLLPMMTGKVGNDPIPEDQRMPPPKSTPLTDDQLNTLKWWLEDGEKDQ